MNDRSGYGNHIAQAVDATRATVAVQVGHGAALVFAGAQGYTSAGNVTLGAGSPTWVALIASIRDDAAAGINREFWAYGDVWGATLVGSWEVGFWDAATAGSFLISALNTGFAGQMYRGTGALAKVDRSVATLWDVSQNPDTQTITNTLGVDISTPGVAGNSTAALVARVIRVGRGAVAAPFTGALYDLVVLTGTGAPPVATITAITQALARKRATV